MIVQGRILIDQRFTIIRQNNDRMDQLDEEMKNDIEYLLNDQFCNLNGNIQNQDNSCNTQVLNIMVKWRISCGTLKISKQQHLEIFRTFKWDTVHIIASRGCKNAGGKSWRFEKNYLMSCPWNINWNPSCWIFFWPSALTSRTLLIWTEKTIKWFLLGLWTCFPCYGWLLSWPR